MAAAAEAARAAAVTARVNIEVNLRGIKDAATRSRAHRHGRGDRRHHGPRRLDRRGRARGDHPVKVLSGRELAAEIRAATAARAAELASAGGRRAWPRSPPWPTRRAPGISGRSRRRRPRVGISCDIIDVAADSSPAAIATTETVLIELSGDPAVHGIILATPLPAGARLAELASLIDPAKDVDGANPVSLGRIMTGLPAFALAMAEAVVRLLDHHRDRAGGAARGRGGSFGGGGKAPGAPAARPRCHRDHLPFPEPGSRRNHRSGRCARRGGGPSRADRDEACRSRRHGDRRRDQRHPGRRPGGRRRRRRRGSRVRSARYPAAWGR